MIFNGYGLGEHITPQVIWAAGKSNRTRWNPWLRALKTSELWVLWLATARHPPSSASSSHSGGLSDQMLEIANTKGRFGTAWQVWGLIIKCILNLWNEKNNSVNKNTCNVDMENLWVRFWNNLLIYCSHCGKPGGDYQTPPALFSRFLGGSWKKDPSPKIHQPLSHVWFWYWLNAATKAECPSQG